MNRIMIAPARTSGWLGIAAALVCLASASASAQPASPLEREIGSMAPRTAAVGSSSEVDRALAARDYERAARLLAGAIERGPESRDLLLQIAGIFMLDRKPLNAAVALKKAEALGPLDARARLQLALAYIAMRRRDWARPELERLAREEPDDVTYTYWLARLDYDDGQYESATRRLLAVVGKAPDFARAHDNLALCYEALHRPEEAIPHYREAVRLARTEKPASGWPALNLGILLRTRGELDEAEALLREAVRHDEELSPAHYQLGVLLEERGRMEEALTALSRAASLDAGYPEPHYAMARIYRRLHRSDRADAALARFKELQDARQRSGR